MPRLGLIGICHLILSAAVLGLASGTADSQTAPGEPEQFNSTTSCPDAATQKIYQEQRAIGARLTSQQRKQHDADLQRWYDRQISECRLRQLNQQLEPYAQTLQEAAQYSYAMRLNAEAFLQAAGRISKQMTDDMDVTKHNNVGIGVALGSYLGALRYLGEGLGLAANTYRNAATAVKAADQQQALLKLAGVAKTQSSITAEEAAQIGREVATEVGSPPLASAPPAPSPPPSVPSEPQGYLTGIQLLNAASQPAISQGNLPTCGVLACQRLAALLGRNISIFQAFNRLRPRVALEVVRDAANSQNGAVLALRGGGLTPRQMVEGLRSMGVRSEVGTGLTNMMNELRAGRPVIAGVRTEAAQGADLHAVVIEGMENRAGVLGLTIYDPNGFAYWQPLSLWQRFFSGVFIRPI